MMKGGAGLSAPPLAWLQWSMKALMSKPVAPGRTWPSSKGRHKLQISERRLCLRRYSFAREPCAWGLTVSHRDTDLSVTDRLSRSSAA